MKETFNMFWQGDYLSGLEKSCMQSFIRKGHHLRVFSYAKAELPPGIVSQDASQILPVDDVFIFHDSPSAFSNIFRYKLLLDEGGWWVDTDTLCLTREVPACDYFWAEQHPEKINGAILKFPKGDPLCKLLFQLATERAKDLTFWGQLGPSLLTEVLTDKTLLNHRGKTSDVYPLHYLETHFLWLPEFTQLVEERIEKSFFLHMWHSVFRKMGIDLDCAPPAGSFLSSLYADQGVITAKRSNDQLVLQAIASYLEEEWIHDLWVGKLHKDIESLIPKLT